MMQSLGIYMHIPFCRSKCNYCDFLTMVPNNRQKIDEYTEYLLREINILANDFIDKEVDTIYFGGGTPSLLTSDQIYKILDCIYKKFKVSSKAEITIEINPETIDNKWIKNLKKAGVNRASVGFQNSNQEILVLIGRKSTLKMFLDTVEFLQKESIDNISADIILSLPNTNVESTLRDARLLTDLNIPHISAYSLILEEKTLLYRQVKEGKIKLLDDELDREIYHEFCHYLKSRGYRRYEVSSFSKAGYESKHNSRYWNLSEYLGLGLGASGFINNMRTKNPVKLSDYYKRIDNNKIPYDIEYELSKEDMMSEYSFLALRTAKGIDKKFFKEKFNVDFDKMFNLKVHEDNGLIINENNFIKLTEKGFDLSNLVEVDLLL